MDVPLAQLCDPGKEAIEFDAQPGVRPPDNLLSALKGLEFVAFDVEFDAVDGLTAQYGVERECFDHDSMFGRLDPNL